MSLRPSISSGDILFLMNKKVVVKRVHVLFRLVAVHYLDDVNEFYVDISALSDNPNFANSISFNLIGV